MSADKNLRDRMRKLRPEELVEIANSSPEEGFELDVIEAAREELAARGISSSELVHLQDCAGEQKTAREGRSERPLSTGVLLVFMAIGPFLIFSIFGLFIYYALRARGYKRMAREAFNASAAGSFVWVVLMLLFVGAAYLLGW